MRARHVVGVLVLPVLVHTACATRPLPRGHRPLATGADAQLRLEWQDEHGRIVPPDLRLHATATVTPTVAGITKDSWTWLGPGNIGGRVTALHITQSGTMLAASAGGGLWRSTNAGQTWQPVDDFLAVLSTTALASDPANPNLIYAGTGEGFGNAGAIRGSGIFKSTDGGTSWALLPSTGTLDFLSVNSLTISASSVLLAATTGTASPGGIWRSTDGGANWTKIVEGADVGTVEFHPTDPSKAIAATRTGQALFSTDGGANWTPSESISSNKRVQVAYARGTPSIVYATVDDDGGQLWKSTDGGVTYAKVNSGTRFLGDQGWLHNALWIDPTNAGTLVVGGLDLWRSTDGGSTLTKISQWQKSPESSHGDQKVVVASPGFDGASNKTVYVGNDGGVYRTQDIYAVEPLGGWEPLNNNLGITQFYGIAGNPITGVLVGGTQDNGTIRYSGDAQKWTPMFGGDGGFVAADPSDSNFFYGEYVNLTVHRSEDGANWKADDIYGQFYSWDGEKWVKLSRANPITEAKSGTANFIAPFVLDPNNPNRVLAGARSLWMTDNAKKSNKEGGPDWRPIKPAAGSSSSNNITAIAVAPGKAEEIWVGHGNGEVYRTTTGLAESPQWTRVGSGTLPARSVLSLAVDPRDSQTAYATFGGFSANNVWKTTNGGASWTSVSTGLPSLPARSLAVHPRNSNWIYLGMELGIFASEDGGTTWRVPHDGPANVAVRQLVFVNDDLLAATFGRGVYKARIATGGAKAAGCFALEITASGPGGVLADVEPDCDHQRGYRAGTVVTLRAHGGLQSWSGAASGNDRVVRVLMNEPKQLSAIFTNDVCYDLDLLVVPAGAGTVTASPPPNCGDQYRADTIVTLHAQPGAGVAFGGWNGDAGGPEPVETLEMDEDHEVTAIFALVAPNDDAANPYDLTPFLNSRNFHTVLLDTSSATNSASDPLMCEAGKSGRTVWFRLVPSKDAVLDLDTEGSNYDTALTVWEVAGTLLSIACDDDSDDESESDTGTVDYEDGISDEQVSYLSTAVRSGRTYLIEVGDATEPEELPADDFRTGGDPGDVPEGGLLVLNAQLHGAGKRRGVRH